MIFLENVKHSRITKTANITVLPLLCELKNRETVTSCSKADVQ